MHLRLIKLHCPLNQWITNLNMGMEHLVFDVNRQDIWAIHLNLQINEGFYVHQRGLTLQSVCKWKNNVQV
jgi:hypothetical protein